MSEKEWVPQTMAATFARIVADPGAAWLAVGDFLDDYRSLPPDGRAALVAAPIAAPGDDIPIPRWTGQPLYRLPEPWFVYEGAPSLRPWMLATTPTPFRMRKIFTGSEVLSRV